MKSKFIIATLAIGLLFMNCKRDEVGQEDNFVGKMEITSNNQLKSQDPLDKYQKEVDKLLKDVRKTMKDKARQKKADELGISVMALPVDSIPVEEAPLDLTDEEVAELMDSLATPSKSYLSSFSGLNYSQNTDEQVVLVAMLGAELDGGLGEGLSYDLIGDTIRVYAPTNGSTFLNKLSYCCAQTLSKMHYSLVTTVGTGIGGQLAGRQGVTVMLETLLGTSVWATIGGMAIGWMVTDALWCMATQEAPTTI